MYFENISIKFKSFMPVKIVHVILEVSKFFKKNIYTSLKIKYKKKEMTKKGKVNRETYSKTVQNTVGESRVAFRILKLQA